MIRLEARRKCFLRERGLYIIVICIIFISIECGSGSRSDINLENSETDSDG